MLARSKNSAVFGFGSGREDMPAIIPSSPAMNLTEH